MGNSCGVPDEMMQENESGNSPGAGTTIRVNKRSKGQKNNADYGGFHDFEEYESKFIHSK